MNLPNESLLTTAVNQPMERVPVPMSSSLLVDAVRDLEPRTNLAAARHHIHNLMATFAHCLVARDLPTMSQLLGLCRITHHPPTGGTNPVDPEHPGRLFDWCNGSALVTTSDLSVWYEDKDVAYRCIYQIWQPGEIAPLIAMGTFLGRLESGPQVWRWAEHHIHEH